MISLGSSVEQEAALVPGVLPLNALALTSCVHVLGEQTFHVAIVSVGLSQVLLIHLWQPVRGLG